MQTFVLNLERAPDRKAAMAEKLQQLGLSAEFLPAVDGRGLPDPVPGYWGRLRRIFFGKDLTLGEIGCVKSHFAAYSEIVKRDLDFALVLEDDAVFAPEFPKALEALAASHDQWDLVRFLASKKSLKRQRILREIGQGLFLTRCYGTPGEAHAYVLNQKAAKRLLWHADKIWVMTDILHWQLWLLGLKRRAVLPKLSWQDRNYQSSIGDSRFDKHRPAAMMERILFSFARPAYKYCGSATKLLIWCLTWPGDKLRSFIRR